MDITTLSLAKQYTDKLSEAIADLRERTKNLFDADNPVLLDAYFVTNGTITGSSKARTLVVELHDKTQSHVTVHVDALTNKFMVAACKDFPDPGSVQSFIDVRGNNAVEENKEATLSITEDANYIAVYFWNSTYDAVTPEEIMESIMVQYGDKYTGFEPFYAPKNTVRIDAIENTLNATDRWITRGKIYGIEFNTNDNTGTCARIADAIGKIGGIDFDNIFPWSDMRLCNVSIVDGKKSITYYGQSAFTRDGTNGNVMVEIPAFYVCRERIGAAERWLISGEAKGGFELHPWFKNADGTTVTHRYYGVYKATEDMADSGVFSHSGSTPYAPGTDVTDKLLPCDFTYMVEPYGYSRNTIYALSALQYLFAIEYATINSQSVFNGVTYCSYFSGTSVYLKPKNIGDTTNTFELSLFTGTFGNSMALLGKGMQVCIGTGTSQFANKRNVVSVEVTASRTFVTVDGEPVTITDDLYCFPIPQDNGLTDSISSRTGVLIGMDAKVAPFKYRYIENPWGNIWEGLDGIRMINGKYYLSDKEHYHDDTADNWVVLGYDAPLISATDAVFNNRIIEMGLDNEYRCVMLPSTLFSNVPDDMTCDRIATMYYGGDAYYSADSPGSSTVYMPYYGGGWDHHENAGLFCMRFLNKDTNKFWLYGERITC